MLPISIQAVATLLFAFAAAVCAYHAVLAMVSLATDAGRRGGECGLGVHDFAILIPAHNEEATIDDVLRSCAALNYPQAKHTVYVIADNCTDATAAKASAAGAVCLERTDDELRGKGHALQWALPQVLKRGHDAVAILDADCLLNADALSIIDRYMIAGDRVLQANYVVSNPDDNSLSYVLATSIALENDLFYAPKSLLGLAVFLRGTGMVLHREVLEQYPWQAGSVVEDMEYSYQLLRAGHRIRYVPEVCFATEFPVEYNQLAVQRTRWIGGNARLSRLGAVKLFWEGLRRGRLRLMDAAFTTLIVSRPLIVAQLALTLCFAVLCRWLAPGPWSHAMLTGSLGIVAIYAWYAVAGAMRVGITAHRLRLVAGAPAVVLRYLVIALRAVLSRSPADWGRTPRIQRVN